MTEVSKAGGGKWLECGYYHWLASCVLEGRTWGGAGRLGMVWLTSSSFAQGRVWLARILGSLAKY